MNSGAKSSVKQEENQSAYAEDPNGTAYSVRANSESRAKNQVVL